MATENRILQTLQNLPKWRGQPIAFLNIILEKCAKLAFYDDVVDAIEALGQAGQLMEYPEYLDGFRVFFEKFPIENNQATRDLIVSGLLRRRLGSTAADMEELLRTDEQTQKALETSITQEWRTEQAEIKRRTDAVAHEARETIRMVDEIVAYMRDENGKVRREYTQRQFDQKQSGLQALPFDQLVARYDEVMAHRALRKASVGQIRDVVKTDATRQRQALYSRYEQIPDLYYPPGKSEGLSWSFNLFKRLPTTEQRRLLEHFGDQAITAACRQQGEK